MTAIAQGSAIDCDVHVAPRSLEPLLAHVDDYWADYAANGELFLSPSMNGMYPPVAFRPGREPGTRAPVPATLEELRADMLDDGAARIAIVNCITAFDTSHNVYYEAAICRAINDWVRTQWLERDERLRASLVLPALDPDAAVDEIERLGAHPGFVQILLPVRADAPYGNKRYHPIFAAAERHDLVVALHAWGRVGNAPTASGFTHSYLEDYVSNSQLIAQAQVTSLVSEGVFERFASLKVALLECGFTWLPFLLWRFDKDWKALWREVAWVKRRPSEYVHHHFRFTTAPAQLPTDPEVRTRLRDLMPVGELLMYSSDFPHRHGGGIDPLLALLDDDDRRAVLAGNAARLYGLEP
jgi:predicted TIM-barrel fold metal-dependent hydrolase